MFGEFTPPYRFETDGLSLSLEMKEGHYQYMRDLAGEQSEKAISVGLSRLLVHPVEPFNTGPGAVTHLEIEFPSLILEAEATETFFLTFPIEVGVFVEGIRDTEVLDVFSVDQPKFSLYGSTHRGAITRFARSERHREAPSVDPTREGILKLALRNTLPEWVRVSRIVLEEAQIHLYVGESAAMMAMMRIAGPNMAEITGVDRPLKGGMNRAHDLFTTRRLLRLGSSRLPGMERKGFLMEEGYS
ncbi:MAG TPA: DUF432 domain-containing protein [Methanomicrobiales archaeon]|nr:DUF432 domain-containing protein [Methanomicrobiales archaeon]